MSQYIKININDCVKVKITKEGWDHLERLDKEQDLPPGSSRSLYAPDDNGYSKMELWKLMNEFGNILYNGCKIPFETEVIISNEYTGYDLKIHNEN